ncbi:major latex protein 146-like [Papaver somniferum]|uniref:major latex protein 146-like n=1 Tax=Papaver somniferum TaxID=3469 RepID=UPI000E701C61|nr:major latex protein 146-like [Papaver somniferum]
MAVHHTISGLRGKLVTELEVNCKADKYYEIFKHHIFTVASKLLRGMEPLRAVSSSGTTLRLRVFMCNMFVHADGKTLYVHEKTTYTDETRTIYHKVVGGDLTKDYKKFDVTLVVDPKTNGHGSIVSWTIEYEKLNEDSQFLLII